jgi:diadenosine tetraphosphate (Ap4A) HIT family hydrolase
MSDCFLPQHGRRRHGPDSRAHLVARWRVAHAITCALPGWLVVVPARHVLSLAELSSDEAAALGPLLAAVSRAVVEVTRCVKVDLGLFAEQEGFEHLHIHVCHASPICPRTSGARASSAISSARRASG